MYDKKPYRWVLIWFNTFSKIKLLQTVHSQYRPIAHLKNLVVVCDGIKSPANLGGLFRICDAFGVQEVISNEWIPLTSGRFKKTARNTHESIAFRQEEDLSRVLSQLQTDGYELIGLEITSHSLPIQHFRAGLLQKIALVVGNESDGISKEILAVLPKVLHIPMFGTNSSMNVIQALAIALFEFTRHE